MSLSRPLYLFACALGLAGTFTVSAQTPPPASPPLRKIAIIVENRAGKILDDKVSVLEDMLTTRVAGEGFSVLSRDVVTRSLKDYSSPGADKSTGPDAAGANLDKMLENNTTALRLAQSIGADFILIPSIMTHGKDTKKYEGNGVVTINTTHTMRIGYKVVEAAQGGAIKGDSVTVSKVFRQSAGLQEESNDVVNELLDDAASQLAAALVKSVSTIPLTVVQASQVTFSVACSLTDLKQEAITVPDIQVTPDNKVVKGAQPLPVRALDVTVELDGLVLGSAPGKFKAQPGLHKIRLSRDDCQPYVRTINIADGLILNVPLMMSDKGYARWLNSMAFLQSIENSRKLTDAEVKEMEGMAKMLSESHYRVDTKENVKIYKSIY